VATLRQLAGNSLEYSLTWSVYRKHEPYKCDWRTDPCLIVIYSPQAVCKLIVGSQGSPTLMRGGAGDTFLIPAGTSHKFDSPACFIGGVCVHYTLFNSLDVLDLYDVPRIVTGDDSTQIGHTIRDLVGLVGQNENAEGFSTDGKLDFVDIAKEREIVFRLLGQVLSLSELRPRGLERLFILKKLRHSLRYIDDNLESKISVDSLGELAGLSAHRFSALFKDVMHNSPHQYILRKRVQKAMALLTSSEASIIQIADELGFHDQPHFTKLFKSVTGVSPTHYRKNYRRRFGSPIAT
jgi:AraC-like DNA-binding protein